MCYKIPRTLPLWKESDRQRAAHEQRLNPRLADANKCEELRELVDSEAKRQSEALRTCQEADFTRFQAISGV